MYTTAGLLDLHRRVYLSLETLLDHVATLPEGALDEENEALGWKALRQTLLHMAESEQFWMDWLQGKPWPKWDHGEYDTLEKIRAAFRRVEESTRAYIGGLTDEQLNTPVPLMYGEERFQTAPALALLHMMTHAFHHKGTVVAVCRLLGQPAPETDLNVSPNLG